MANESDKVELPTTKHTVKEDLVDDLRMALASQKKTSHQRVAADVKNGEKLFANKAAIKNEFESFGKIINPELIRLKGFWTKR